MGAYHSMCRSETGRVRAIFIARKAFAIHRTTQKTSGFHRKNDTGWGRALTVWEPAQSVIKKA